MVRSFLIVAAVCCLLAGGCTEAQREKVDAAADQVNSAVPPLTQTVDGPAGALLPAKVRDPLQLGLLLAGAAATIWQTWRRRQVTDALGSVVVGVERAPEEAADTVKESIKEAMVDRGNYVTADKIIEAAKG